MSRSCLSHALHRSSRGGSGDSGDGAHHIAVHEEGNRLTESSCEGNLAKLGSWIVATHGPAQTKAMLGSLEARDKAATDLLGSYYRTSPEFKTLLDAVCGPMATDEARRSGLRESLHKIELSGMKGIKTLVAEVEQGVAA